LDDNALIQPESGRAFQRLLAQGWTDAMPQTTSRWTALDILGLQIRSVAEGQGHAARSLSALAGRGPAACGRWR
jgi:hypothetical protein